MKEKITVIVSGDPFGEHFTYVEMNNIYYEFYDDGYDGVGYVRVISFLRFLGFDVFLIYKNKNHRHKTTVNWMDFVKFDDKSKRYE